MAKPALLVLAAGIGSRFGGLKQMEPVGPNGEWIIDYSVFDAMRAGFGRVVFVIRREMTDLFREAVGSRFEGRIKVDYAFQDLDDIPAGFTVPEGREKPWGTGHAVLSASGIITGSFAVINADDFYGMDAYRQMSDFLTSVADPESSQYAMVGYQLSRTLSEHGIVSRGICHADMANNLLKIVERTRIEREADSGIVAKDGPEFERLTGKEMVSMNFWGFTPIFFEQLHALFEKFLLEQGNDDKSEFFLPSAVDELIGGGRARVSLLPTNDAWYGVTYSRDKPAVVEGIRVLIEKGVYPPDLGG